MRVWAALLLLVTAGHAALSWGAPPAFEPLAYLKSQAWLTPGEAQALDKGVIIAKVVDTPDRSEVFSLGVMRVRTSVASVLLAFRDVDGPRKEQWVLASRRLEEPPYTRELTSLPLDKGDLRDLSRCKLHDCDIRLPADAIGQFQEIRWASPGSGDRAQEVFRDLLSAMTLDYQARGDAALFRYDNNDDPVKISDSLDKLFARPLLLGEAAPDVLAFLERYPEGRPEDTEDFFYWMKEKFWLLDVMSLSHVVLVNRATEGGRVVLQATKQLYATHYYESSLGVLAYFEQGGVVVFLNRTRADIRRTGFTWVERTLLRLLVRGRIDARLRHLRRRLESP